MAGSMAGFLDHHLACPSKAELRERFVGKKLRDVGTPAAIVDRFVVQRNCNQLLAAVESLQIGFRPHVKTHKTVEVAQKQVCSTANEVKFVVSTLAEAQHLLPFLQKSRQEGKSVNVLYGIPLPPSQVYKLADLGKELGPGSVSALVDDVAQLSSFSIFKEITGHPLQTFIKVDTGSHRAGLPTETAGFQDLVQAVFILESRGLGSLVGFYSYAGHSYQESSSISAMKLLCTEIEGLENAAAKANLHRPSNRTIHNFVLSVGATPTATSVEYLAGDDVEPTVQRLRNLLQRNRQEYCIELHAGVYPFLDLQQLATHASPSAVANDEIPRNSITLADVALSILVEVASVYKNRNRPEALIAAGTLALGREPCKSYDGWGIVSDWGMETSTSAGQSGWKVGRISQEHGILTEHSESNQSTSAPLRVGQKLRIWPNHACVASAGFSWYLLVDSSLPEDRWDEIVGIWVRCRGW